MNKLISVLLGTTFLILTSCGGGGWSDDQKNTVKNECITLGGYDCDCYVEKAVDIFANPEEYNKKASELNEKFEVAIVNCEVQTDVSEDDLESF